MLEEYRFKVNERKWTQPTKAVIGGMARLPEWCTSITKGVLVLWFWRRKRRVGRGRGKEGGGGAMLGLSIGQRLGFWGPSSSRLSALRRFIVLLLMEVSIWQV